GAVQRLDLRDAKAAVVDTGRQERRASTHPATAREGDEDPVGLPPQVGHSLHEREIRPENPCLLVRLQSQAAPAEASREAEVVANQWTRGRLAPEPAFVNDQRAKS